MLTKLKRKLYGIKFRCSERSINSPCYKNYYGKGVRNFLTLDDLIYLWKRDNAGKLKRPSIDRIDSSGNYIIGNCRFIELSENCAKGVIRKCICGKRLNTNQNKYCSRRCLMAGLNSYYSTIGSRKT